MMIMRITRWSAFLLVASLGFGGCDTGPDAQLDSSDSAYTADATDTRTENIPDITGSDAPIDAADSPDTADSRSDAPDAQPDAEDTRGDADPPVPTSLRVSMTERELICKLISERELNWETENYTHTRFNLRGTDLGTPAIVGDELHLFFGDTHGFREIWHIGEDPDSVARVSLEAARQDLTTLCRDLNFYVTGDIPGVANPVDARIQRDFEGGYLLAPPGESIRDYIDRPVPAFETPSGSFAGSFEVPTGAVTHNGETYIFWSTRSGVGAIEPMRLSFVSHWPSAGASPLNYQILYKLDSLANLGLDQPLGAHFIQVAPLVAEDGYLYLFGTGLYRRDGVHLARKPADDIANPGGFELYDPRDDSWTSATSMDAPSRAQIPAIIDEDIKGIGELGVQFVEEAGLYVVMYQQLSEHSAGNRMIVQVAPTPTGPWTKETVILMSDPLFALKHCCIPNGECPGERVIHCDRGGLYGIYPLPLIEAVPDGDGWTLKVPFVASTWQPYNVVLFQATLSVQPIFD